MATVKKVMQQVRPILSVDKDEARRRMFNLYKAWYRQCPQIGNFRNIIFNYAILVILTILRECTDIWCLLWQIVGDLDLWSIQKIDLVISIQILFLKSFCKQKFIKINVQ